MKHAAPLCLLLALAGCGSLNPDAAFTDPGCREAMYQDPVVQMRMRATAGPVAGGLDVAALAAAKQVAYDRCVGGAKPGHGGVQKVL